MATAALTTNLGCGGALGDKTAVLPVSKTYLSETVKTSRTATKIPAVYAAVISSDAIVIDAEGVQKQGETVPAQKEDLTHLGSNTKSFTTTLIGQFVESGRMRWDMTIGEVFPEFTAKMHPEFRNVTIKMLLEMRGGVSSFFDALAIRSLPRYIGTTTERRYAFTDWVLQQEPETKPGEYNYSNGGYIVAAAMLEKITGQSWDALLQDRLYRPLGITTAVIGWPATGRTNQPWGHTTNDDGTFTPHDPNNPDDQPESYFAPAGDISMSLGDYAKYVQMNLRGLRGQKTLLQASTVRDIHTPPVDGDYALGWGTDSTSGEKTSFYVGSLGTFLAYVQIKPNRNRAVVVVTNVGESSAESSGALIDQLMNASSRK